MSTRQPISDPTRMACGSASLPARDTIPADRQRIYELRGLRFQHGDQFALQIDEFILLQNEKVAIVGPNGSGKTTLLRILAFLERCAAWTSFRYLGKDCAPGRGGSRNGLGFLKQNPYLFSGTVAQNLAYPLTLRRVGRRETRERVEAMLATVDLATRAQMSARRLSGGEQRRLALGRVLIAEPEILLLDEPMAHLDRHSQDIIARVLDANPPTLLFTTHDLRLAHRLATRVLNLNGGKLSENPPENVLAGLAQGNSMVTRGGLTIHLSGSIRRGPIKIALDPRNLVLSLAPLASSMRNQFRGRIVSVHDQRETVWLEIDCGDTFTAIITRESYRRMGLNLHTELFISFKAQAVEVL